jgi:hypothetical protein
MSLAYFYRPVVWTAGNWTFAVYSRYARGHFYNAHPRVFVTYKGGNNRRDVRFYADRHMNKPVVHHNTTKVVHHNKPAVHNNNTTWRSNGHSNGNVSNGRGNGTSNRHIAQATSTNRNSAGHFGGRK